MKPGSHRANALFNLIGGASTSLLVLGLPFLLTRSLSQAEFAAWVIGFQAALYIPMLGLGIQHVINRAVAHTTATQGQGLNDQLQTALQLVLILVLVGFVVITFGGFFLMDLTNAPSEFAPTILGVWYRVGIGSALGLMSLFFIGYFGGLQRYEWENIYKASVSLGFLGLVLLSLWITGSLNPLMLANLYILMIVASLAVLVIAFRAQHCAFSLSAVLRPWHNSIRAQYLRGIYGTSMWQVAMLLITGFDILIVARLDFLAVPGYAIGLSVMTFLTGFIGALVSPCLPRFAAELAKGEGGQFRLLFLAYQKRLILACLVITLVLLLIPKTLWMTLFGEAAPVFQLVMPILLLANCIRYLTILYTLALVSANLQHRVVVTPLMEGVINISASILLGSYFGPIGVAWGTLVGAVFCLAAHAFYNSPRTAMTLPLSPRALLFPWRELR